VHCTGTKVSTSENRGGLKVASLVRSRLDFQTDLVRPVRGLNYSGFSTPFYSEVYFVRTVSQPGSDALFENDYC
jgi:hypothetical protein